MTTKILLLSDLHVEFAPFVPDPAAVQEADVVVLAGDIHNGVQGIRWARKTFLDKPIVYVAGNHEFYGYRWERLPDQLRAAGRAHEVHFLENEGVNIGGMRFLGCTLWTDFDYFGVQRRAEVMREVTLWLMDYQAIKAQPMPHVYWSSRHLLTALHTLKRHQESRAWLERELAGADPAATVVVTHHYPHGGSTAAQYRSHPGTGGFGSHLPEELITGASLWVHGHTHTSHDYCIEAGGRTARVLCNPRGYILHRRADAPENDEFNPALVVPVGGDVS